jgi:hypothetical protein
MPDEIKPNRRRTKPIKKNKDLKLKKEYPIEEEEKPSFYQCSRCGKKLTNEDSFPASQSELYAGWGYRLPICKPCLDKLFDFYTQKLGDEDEAIRRICMKFDIYFSQSLANASRKITKNRSRIHTYISRSNLGQYSNKSYDTTIEEESGNTIESIDDLKDNKDIKVSQRTVKFFGTGFQENEYKFLADQYEDWTARHECKTKAQEELFKNLCIAQLNIQKETQKSGGKVDAAMDTFQKLLGSANIKPTQTNDNALADQNTFGTLIQKWENEKPISEPLPEFKDVDGIVKYISIWFLGHLCKMLKIKNSYSAMYEKEMEKYKVSKPQYDDDTELLFDDVFGGDDSGE